MLFKINLTQMKQLKINVLVLTIAVVLSGCAAAMIEGLAVETALITEEVAIASEFSIAVGAEAGELAIVSEEAFLGQLETIKIDPVIAAENPNLYTLRNGARQNFGVLKNNRIIDINKLNKQLVIDGELYRVKGDNVKIRTSRGENYSIYKIKNTDDLVMVVEKDYELLKIKTGDNEYGYIESASVVPATNKGETNTPTNSKENQDKYYFIGKTTEQNNLKTNSPHIKEISCIVFNDDNSYNQNITSLFIENFKNKGCQIVSNSSLNYPSILKKPDVIIYNEKISNKTDYIAVGTYSENTFKNTSGTIYKFSTSATLNYKIINTKTFEENAYSFSGNGIGLNEIESKNNALKKIFKQLNP